jgi:2-dehydropantoate 2-reductase
LITDKGSGFASSMYRDTQGDAPVEVEHILTDKVRRASGVDLMTPLLDAAVAQLRIPQNRVLAASRS